MVLNLIQAKQFKALTLTQLLIQTSAVVTKPMDIANSTPLTIEQNA